jgi:hypothetical protein
MVSIDPNLFRQAAVYADPRSTSGDGATAAAREMVDKMRRRGDAKGAGVWLRIIVATGTLDTGLYAMRPRIVVVAGLAKGSARSRSWHESP